MIAYQTTEDQFTFPGFSPAKLNRWRYFIQVAVLSCVLFFYSFGSSAQTESQVWVPHYMLEYSIGQR